MSEFSHRDRFYTFLWVIVVAIGAAVGFLNLYALFNLDDNGISMAARKPPTWDFTNLWFGGRLVLEGDLEVLFQPEVYREALRRLFAPYIDDSEWGYPPSILLIGVPLALFPLYAAWGIWTIGSLCVLWFVARRAGLSRVASAVLLISPGVLINIFFGQNGALTASLLFAGLMAADRRPWLAGLCFGLLTMKPHLGILVPFCLIAAGLWRAVGWSVFFAALVVLATTVAVGPAAWTGFLQTTQPLMRGVLELPYGHGYQGNSITVFLSMRAAGFDLQATYAIQICVILVAVAMVWWIWRRPCSDPLLRASITAIITLLATPYGYSYDMVMLSFALVVVAFRGQWRLDILLVIPWLWPVFTNVVNRHFAPVSPLVISFALLACLYVAMQREGWSRPRLQEPGPA